MLLVVLVGCLFAQTPRLLNYQGKLTNTDGVGLNGDYDITFMLYSVSTGGAPLFSEAHTGVNAVTVTKGLFDVQLGSITAGEIDLQFGEQYYLELMIGAETLIPREKLATSPYAFHSIISDTAFVLAGDHGAVAGQILKWDGDSWESVADEGGTDDQNLTEVLESGNSAGTYDIDMNDNAILNIDWLTSDDGSGSNLDADLLDGQDGVYYLDNTDDQALTLEAGNTLTLEDGGTVDLTPYLDNTDDQDLSYTAATRSLDISGGIGTFLPLFTATDAGLAPLSGGGTSNFLRADGSWVTPSSGTDDQTDAEVPLTDWTPDLVYITELGNVHTAIGELDAAIYVNEVAISAHNAADGDLDDANELITAATWTDGTDLLRITEAGVDWDVTIDNEADDLTDNVINDLSNVNATPLSGQILSWNGTNWVAVADEGGSDDQALTLEAGNILTLEDGGTVDLTPYLDNTDDQALTLGAGNILTLEDGGTVDLTPYLDNTDNQNIFGSGFSGITNILTIGIEDGSSETVDLSDLDNAGSDDQDLSFTGAASPYSLDITDGTSVTFAEGVGITLSRSLTELTIAAVLGNTIEGSEITDGTIMNADINISAAIDWTKFATGTANRILMTNGSGVMTVVNAPTADYYLKWNGTAYEWAAVTGDMQDHTDGAGLSGGVYNGGSAITWDINTGNGIEIDVDDVAVKIIDTSTQSSGLDFDASGNLKVATGAATTASTTYKVFRNY